MANRIILVIDDDKNICRIVKEGLEQTDGINIITSYNGKDGFHMAKRAKPDLILLDIGMPVMDGFKVLQLLKQNEETYSIPVVMLSGADDDISRITASKLYCEDYLSKPIGMMALKGRIDTILSRMGV
jgi:DNA-binding response OmpR family regulator